MPIQSWAHGAYWYEKGGTPPAPTPESSYNYTWKWWMSGFVLALLGLQLLDAIMRSRRIV